MNSVWLASESVARFDALNRRMEADVAVIGGGITGTTTALLLHDAGLRVVLLEADVLGAGNTGKSTGNLYGTVSQDLAALRRKWDAETVREAVRLRLRALDLVEANVARFGIGCGFARRTHYLCVEGNDAAELSGLEAEYDALAEAGLAPAWCDDVPLPFTTTRALKMEGQAQFDPFLYVQGLGAELQHRGVPVFERSRVLDIDAGDGRVQTDSGEVRAGSIVIATHSPIGFNLVQAQMQPLIEYGIAAPMPAGAAPEGIFWVRDTSRSLRHYQRDGADYLIAVGETHKTGEADQNTDYLQRLRDYAHSHFGASRFEHSWSAQQFRPADGLPYIGRSAHDNVFIATGFAADGLTWGSVAAQLLGDLIARREEPALELFSPRRFTPIKSAKVWAQENATVLKHLVGDRLSAGDAAAFAAVPTGEGRIVELERGRKFAVHRATDGTLSVLSPVCPHLKCHVAWNESGASWDCPCHGSRFHPDGRVMEGPALEALERFPLEADGPA